MSLSLNLGLIFFIIYLILNLVTLRMMRKISPSLLVCSNALLIYFSALLFIGAMNYQINFFSFSSLYWFLALTLLMFFGAIYKSISLRMMLHLFHQPNNTDRYDVILENYIKDQSYHNRIDILLDKKLIEPSTNHSFNLTKKGQELARKLLMMQQLFSIKESG